MTGMSSSVLMLSIGLLLQCVSSVDPGVGTLVPAPSPSAAAPPAPSSDSGAPSSPAASPPPSAPGAPSSAAPPSAPGHPSSVAPPPSAAAVSPAPGDPPSDSGALTPPPLYTSSAAAAAAAPAPSSDSGAPSSPAASPPPSAPGSPSSAAPPSAHVDPSSAAPPASAPGDASSAPDANSAPGGPTSSTGDLSSAPGAPTPAPSSPPSAPTVPAPFPGAHSSAKPTDLAPQKTTVRTGSQGTDLLSSGSPGPAVTADRSSPLTTAPLVSTQKPQDPKTAEPVLPTSGRGTPSRPPSGHVTMRPATTARNAMAPTSEPQDRQNKASSGATATVVHGTVGASAPGGSNPGLQIKTFSFPLTEDHKEYHVQTALCEKVMQGRAHCNCTASWPPQDPGAKLGPGDICIKVQCKDEDVNFPKSNSQLVVGDKTTLIAILASCGALLAMIIGLGIYATHHRKPYAENQQHLTEELHTVENGYHDNPTLDVMEVQPEMQEKTHIGNEFNDSWIVPMETIVKEVLPDEEDTHL